MEFLIIFPDWGDFPLPYRRRIAPLSPATLAGILNEWGTITYIDQRLEEVPLERTFDVVFITAMTNQISRAYQLADQFRTRGTTVALGGVHPSLRPREAAQHADAVFIGEAEETLPRFIQDVLRNKVAQQYVCEAREQTWNDRCLPDRSIYPGKGYLPLDPVQFFRGCRLACEACSVPQTQGKQVMFHGLDRICRDLEQCTDYLFFTNDDLDFHKSSISPILEELSHMNKYWLGLGSTDLVQDEDYLALLKRSGCWLLYLDFGPREAMALNHPARMPALLRQMQHRLAKIKDSGIKILASFSFGYDFDTAHIFDNTLEFCDRNGIDEAEFHVIVPYPNSRMARKLEADQRILTRDWRYYTATQPVFQPLKMSVDQLHEGYLRAWKTFYKLAEFDPTQPLEIESFRAFPNQKPDRTVY